jgi:virginiamycin B lyase
MTPAGSLTEFVVPTGNPGGFNVENVSITNGPDGDLWFTSVTNSGIGRITTTGTIGEFTLPPPPSIIAGLITGKSDGTLWFIEGKLIPNQTETYEIGKLTLT